MNVQKLAKVFGIVFLAIGILGFVPALTPDGHLLGLFEVDTMHNVIHILTGVLALLAAGSVSKAGLFFKVFGVVYALVTVLGFVMDGEVLGLIHTNMADNVLHLVVAAVALYAGFGMKSKMSSM